MSVIQGRKEDQTQKKYKPTRVVILGSDTDRWPTKEYSLSGQDAEEIIDIARRRGIPLVNDTGLVSKLYRLPESSRIPERFIHALIELYRFLSTRVERRLKDV